MADPTRAELARYIEHTNLQAYATEQDIVKLCAEARAHGFHGVCINPTYVPLAAKELAGSPVTVVTVCGFPLGATPTPVKVYEAQWALGHGAKEIDMVINVSAVKSGRLDAAEQGIAEVVKAVHAQGGLVKLIAENCYLTRAEKAQAWAAGVRAGVDFLKTSTGFGKPYEPDVPPGATITDVALMRALCGPTIGVKAAGGISDYPTACAMIAAGANRLGTSKGVQLWRGAPP
jgi:deoxyribose-phosphate aldolase